MDEPIEKAISPDEKIVWKGRRNKKILEFYLFLGFIITALVSALFLLNEQTSHRAFFIVHTPGHAVSILALILGVIISLLIYSSKKRNIFVITDKKTLIKKGKLNSEIIYIEHKDIVNISLKKSLIDRLFNVGSINIDSGKKIVSKVYEKSIRGPNTAPPTPKPVIDSIKHIENPEKLYNMMKRLADLNREK